MYGALLCDEASSDASVRERNIVENEKVGPAKKARKVGHRQSWMPRPAAKISYTAVISASSSTNRESFTLIHEPSCKRGRNTVDSPNGGPIMEWDENHWNQVGIVSYLAKGCASASDKPLFTRIAPYYNWIDSILRKTNHSVSNVPPSLPTTPETTTAPIVTAPPRLFQCKRSSVQCGCGLDDVALSQTRIIGGHEAKPYSWSMMVSLRLNNSTSHSCGGSILNEHFVLTAAHCVDTQSFDSPVGVSVSAGFHDQSDTRQTIRQVNRIIIHPGWQKGSKEHRYDIAILHLSEPLKFSGNSDTYPTCVPHVSAPEKIVQTPPNGTQLVVIGWGTMLSGSLQLPLKLQQAEVFAIGNTDPICSRSIGDVQLQFCAGLQRGGKGTAIF